MNFKKRLAAILAVGITAGLVWFAGMNKLTVREETENPFLQHKDTLYLWYTDEALTDYLSSAAVAYNEKYNVRIVPRLTTGRDYLEELNEHSLSMEEMPDLYIVSNDSLEKAWLSGLASEIRDHAGIADTLSYPQTALDAVTYKGKMIAYPFYYETSILLYNKTYLEQYAQYQIEAEKDAAEGEAAMAAIEEASVQELENGEVATADTEAVSEQIVSAEEIEKRVQEYLPENMDELLLFADGYDAPEAMESIFKWDVTDIFYSYFFSGKYVVVGGEAGDDTNNIDIYNQNAMDCLKVYQNLNQFFSIDTEEVEYADIIKEFMEGKILYTIATSDAVATLEQAKTEGLFDYEYGVSLVPDPSETLQGRSLSVTNGIVVNGFSEYKEQANSFAAFLVKEYSESLYERTGKLPSFYNTVYDNEKLNGYMKEYEKSIPIPKMMATSNFWVQLEIAYTNIWDGKDVNDTLRALSEQIKSQVTGEAVTEEYIEEPETETEEEWIDEEQSVEAQG